MPKSNEYRINFLQESHDLLDKRIAEAEAAYLNETKVHELKKQKLLLKDEIDRLTKLQTNLKD